MVTETGARGPARTTLKMKAKISSETLIIITNRHGVTSQKRFLKYAFDLLHFVDRASCNDSW
jgi:hypothetical protein